MKATLTLMFPVLLILSTGAASAAPFEPSLEGTAGKPSATVLGSNTGNPVVVFNSDLTSPGILRFSFTETARWIVSSDFNGDGRDEAAVLFEKGSLEFLYLERDNLRSRASINGFSPEAPPVVLNEFGQEPFRAVLAVDNRGDLQIVQMEGTRTRALLRGVSPLTSPLVGDLDGDGSSEIAAVDEEGKLLFASKDRSKLTEPKVELLPDTRLTMADADGDGKPEIMAFTRPSSKFSFGRMGDDVEATAIAAFRWDGKFLSLSDEWVLPDGEAFECLVPIIAPVESGAMRVLTTISTEAGSRIATLSYGYGKFREDRTGPLADGKTLILAVGAYQMGDVERPVVIAVSSPEGNGTLEGFRSELTSTHPRLERKISIAARSTRSLGMALMGDFDADRQLELLAPGEDRTTLRIFDFETSRIRAKEIFNGAKAIASNICVGDFDGDGRHDVMVGLDGGGMVILSGR